jgi:hypothetical protein
VQFVALKLNITTKVIWIAPNQRQGAISFQCVVHAIIGREDVCLISKWFPEP